MIGPTEIVFDRPVYTDYQRAFLFDPAPITAVEACTKSGKSYAHLAWLFECAHTPKIPGNGFQWIGPTLDQAREIAFAPLERLVRTLPGYRIVKAPMSITTPAGGVLHFKTGEHPDHLYGPSNIDEVVIDEFTRQRLAVFDAAMSLVTATGGHIKMIGNYTGEDSAWHVWLRGQFKNPNLRYWKITANDAIRAGIMTQERVDKARESLSPSVFAALYMCEGVSDPSMLMDYAAIMDIWVNDHVKAGQKSITADIARYGHDSTVIGLWEGLRLTSITRLEKSGMDLCVATIKHLANLEGVPMSRVVVDDDGVGGGVVDYLKCVPFNGGTRAEEISGAQEQYANLRSQCYFRLAQAVNDRDICIATQQYREEIERDMFLVRRGDDRQGKLAMMPKDEVKLRLGRSPDFSDMLMMRMKLELQPSAKLVESIHRGAEQRRQPKRPKITGANNWTFGGR